TQVEIVKVLGHAVGRRKSRGGIFGRVAGDVGRGLHGLGDGVGREIRGRGAPLSPAEIKRYGEVSVTLALERLHFTEPHGDGESVVHGGQHFGARRALFAGGGQG